MNYRTAFILIEETISSSVYTLNFKLIAMQYRKSGFFRGISFRANRVGEASFPYPITAIPRSSHGIAAR